MDVNLEVINSLACILVLGNKQDYIKSVGEVIEK